MTYRHHNVRSSSAQIGLATKKKKHFFKKQLRKKIVYLVFLKLMAATEQYLRLFLTLTQFFSFPLAIKSFTRQLLVAIICPMSLANALSSASHSDKRISNNILFLFIGFSMFLKFWGAHYTLSFFSEQIQNSLGRNPILGVPGEI